MRLRVIMGPTASGKSAMALREAQACGGEIISADSMQLYRALAIGTAQPTPEERRCVVHHLVGIYELSERADVFRYCEGAERAIRDVLSRGKQPILAGGTGMYLKALLYGMDDLPGDRALRQELDAQYDSDEREEELRERLRSVDLEAAERFANCRRRMLRALEVYLLSGRSLLELQQHSAPKLRFEVDAVRLDPPADLLKRKIRLRAQAMLKNGWIEEAREALKNGLESTPTARQAIGYHLIGEFLRNKLTQEELADRISIATWQYARRQRTWFRHQHPEAVPLA